MPSRRELIALTDAERREYLNQQKTLVIVSNGANGYPHPMPMWFCVDDNDCFYCTTFEKSQKVLNLKRDPRATLLVESGEDYAELKSVLAYADAEVIADQEVVLDTLVAINSKGSALDDSQLSKIREAMIASAKKRVVLKFVPNSFVTWDHSKLAGKY